MIKINRFMANFLRINLWTGESVQTKTASVTEIPNLTEGTPTKSCADCYHFMVYRQNLALLNEGADIIGPCNLWGAYSTAHKLCKSHEKGGPDVR